MFKVNNKFFCSVFSPISIEHWEMRSISPYSTQIWEKTVKKNSGYGLFSGSEKFHVFSKKTLHNILCKKLWEGFQEVNPGMTLP